MDLAGDWGYIEQTASHRLENNWTPRQVEGKPHLEVIGAAGELAARRFLGLPEALHANFDGGTDLKWRGKRIDVKATIMTYNIGHRYLQWPLTKFVMADIIMLVGVDLVHFQAAPIGYAFKREVEIAPVNYGREYPCKEIQVIHLHPVWELYTLRPNPNEQ